MASCKFALDQMKKHGWTEGSGLGKDEDGMSEAIKVTLKMDKAGMGHDPGKEFTDHWWMRAFNDAAKQTGLKTKDKKHKEEEITETKESARKKRFYAGFVKTSTLSNGVEESHKDKPDSTDEEEDEKASERLPTLDELHKYCDGATGHRASMALGGVKMSGKLARVAEADRLFELRMREKSPGDNPDASQTISLSNNSGNNQSLSEEPTQKKKKKKKKKKCDKDLEHEVNIEDCDSSNKSQKKRKFKGSEEGDSITVLKESHQEDFESELSKKHKKKKKSKYDEEVLNDKQETENIEMIVQSDEKGCGEKKKKRKTNHDTIEMKNPVQEITTVDMKDLEQQEENEGAKKKKRKKKRKHELEEIDENANEKTLNKKKKGNQEINSEEQSKEITDSGKKKKSKKNKRKKHELEVENENSETALKHAGEPKLMNEKRETQKTDDRLLDLANINNSHSDCKSLENFVILEPLEDCPPTQIMNSSAGFNHKTLEYELREEYNRLHCVCKLENEEIANISVLTKKGAKNLVAEAALNNLKDTCWTIQTKQACESDPKISKEELMDELDKENFEIKKDNIGFQLLAKMGWSGGGVGKDGTGIDKPVEVNEAYTRSGMDRQGFGDSGGITKEFRRKVKEMIQEYEASYRKDDLVFGCEFSNEERKVIHQMCRKFGLKSKSKGKGSDRFLTAQRKRSVSGLLNMIIALGGETKKYKIVPPRNQASRIIEKGEEARYTVPAPTRFGEGSTLPPGLRGLNTP